MKVVINECHGGFGLSPNGIKRYLELKGQNAYFYIQSKYRYQDGEDEFIKIDSIEFAPMMCCYCTTFDNGEIVSTGLTNIFTGCNIKRNDSALVQVVEELGEEASGTFADLQVVEIENGRWFKIDEYDGFERIQYRDIDDEWMLAE